MRIHRFFLSALVILGSAGLFAQSSQTLTGTLTDTMCGADHMMKDVTAAQCVRECVKQGSGFGLFSGGKVYTLKGNNPQLDKYAGQKVTVKGKISGNTVAVDEISVTK